MPSMGKDFKDQLQEKRDLMKLIGWRLKRTSEKPKTDLAMISDFAF